MVVDRLFVLFESLMSERESHCFIVVAHRSDLHMVGCDMGHFLVCIHIVGFINDGRQHFRNILLIHVPQLFIRDVRQARIFLVVFLNGIVIVKAEPCLHKFTN